MSDDIDRSGRTRAAALLLTAASASAAVMAFAAPALSALPVARNHSAVAVGGDPCLVTVEGPGAAKAPTCAGD